MYNAFSVISAISYQTVITGFYHRIITASDDQS